MTDINIDALVDEYFDLMARREQLTERIDSIKAQLAVLPLGAHSTATGAKVTVSKPVARWSNELANQIIPESLKPLCMETTISSKLAKEILPPAIYNQCRAASSDTPTVAIKA